MVEAGEQRRQVQPRRPCSLESGPSLDCDGSEGGHGRVCPEVEVKAETEGRVELAGDSGSTCRRAPDALDGHGRRGCG
jgi:hypothetical protein